MVIISFTWANCHDIVFVKRRDIEMSSKKYFRNITKHSHGHMIFLETPKVSLEDCTTLLNINDCTLKDGAMNNWLQKL
ncbi:hypothetical protein HanIR_Chr16g0801971 [Helianthus annuus]|nr:hypothetical protein HanIR_Chr16g0801971 [Helianthus annuus]